jgi:hypothetical protein
MHLGLSIFVKQAFHTARYRCYLGIQDRTKDVRSVVN